jgi:hypothetical protein
MKLRIKGNSIRLRLLRSEVDRFAAAGRISDTVRFGVTELRYSLSMSVEIDSITVEFNDNEIAVLIPEAAARDWATGDAVGLETERQIGSGESLSILIEKDFACVDRPDDPDREDAFPNPSLECGRV